MKQMVYVVVDKGIVVGVYDEYEDAEKVASLTATITPVVVDRTDVNRKACNTPSEVVNAMQYELQNMGVNTTVMDDDDDDDYEDDEDEDEYEDDEDEYEEDEDEEDEEEDEDEDEESEDEESEIPAPVRAILCALAAIASLGDA